MKAGEGWEEFLKERGYEIREAIQETDTCGVYRGMCVATGEHVICKRQRRDSSGWEAELLARDGGRLLPCRREYFCRKEEGILIMEELQGESLSGLVKRKGCMTTGQVRRLGIKLAECLRDLYIRTGMVCHGDLKPDHIWRQGKRIRILDVGASFRKGISPGFGAPERIFTGDGPHEREDVYSLAKVLLFLLLGELPDEEALKLLREKELRGSRGRLLGILGEGTECEPSVRIQSMEELIEGLRLSGRPWGYSHYRRKKAGERLLFYKDIWEGQDPVN